MSTAMSTMDFVCLNCGYEFKSRKGQDIMSKARQCPKCWSYHVIPFVDYIRTKERAKELIRTTPLGLVPIWDVAQAVFLERGVTLTPALNLKLCALLLRDITAERQMQNP